MPSFYFVNSFCSDLLLMLCGVLYHLAMKIVAINRRAKFDYEIVDTLTAGIILTGQEVKSCRLGHINLAGAFISLRSGRPVLKGMSISRYSFAGPDPHYDMKRERELLLQKREMEQLLSAETSKGLTIIPLQMTADRYIKLTIGIARGRKKFDKRQVIKERDIARRVREL